MCRVKKTLSTWNSLDTSEDALEMYTHSHGTGPKNGSAPQLPFEWFASRHFLFCGVVRTSQGRQSMGKSPFSRSPQCRGDTVPQGSFPLYTTVSIDYLFVCTPDYRLFWTRWGGSRDKIFSVRRGYIRGGTVPPGSFPLNTTVSIDYIFCLYPRLPAVLDAVGWVPGQKYFRCGGGTVAATLYHQALSSV